MSYSELDAEEPKPYPVLRKFVTYLVFGLLIWVTALSIMNSSNMLNTLLVMGIMWVIGVWIFRRRASINRFLKSDKTLKEHLRDLQDNKKMMRTKAYPVKPATTATAIIRYDYSEADNSYLAPLTDSEQKMFSSLVERYSSDEDSEAI